MSFLKNIKYGGDLQSYSYLKNKILDRINDKFEESEGYEFIYRAENVLGSHDEYLIKLNALVKLIESEL